MGLIKLISNIEDTIDFDVTLQEILDSMIKNKTKEPLADSCKQPII